MKKLLALVLCVMMFVSVLSTNAFADKATIPAHPDLDTGTLVPTPRAAANNKAVANAKANIEYMYGALAANNAVFGTIQSMDSVISGIAKELFSGVDYFRHIPGGKLESNTKTVLRDYIGSAIVDYMNDHRGDYETGSRNWTVTLESTGKDGNLTYTGKTTPSGDPIYIDADGNIYGRHVEADRTVSWYKAPANTNVTEAQHDIGNVWRDATKVNVGVKAEWSYDPIAYANTFAAAVNDTFNSKDGASLIESLAYQVYAAKVYEALDEKFDDLEKAIVDWEDGSAILSQYHFHETKSNAQGGGWDNEDVFSPFAMMDLDNYPNTMTILPGILAP